MQNPPPNQPGYGDQYGAPPPSYGSTPGDETRAKSALGLDANVGAALGYPIGIIGLIIFIMEKDNRFARFHALQSLLYHVAWVVLMIVLVILFVILTFVIALISSTSSAGGAVGGLLGILITLGWLVIVAVYLGGLIFAAVKAYGGSWFKLPIIGNMAEKIVNK
jgi:uncharacterized membrane protein